MKADTFFRVVYFGLGGILWGAAPKGYGLMAFALGILLASIATHLANIEHREP
jgi:hypothetical protein